MNKLILEFDSLPIKHIKEEDAKQIMRAVKKATSLSLGLGDPKEKLVFFCNSPDRGLTEIYELITAQMQYLVINDYLDRENWEVMKKLIDKNFEGR